MILQVFCYTKLMRKYTILVVCILLPVLLGCAKEQLELADDTGACIEIYQPVCGDVDGGPRTYSNACFAEAAGAISWLDGECEAE